MLTFRRTLRRTVALTAVVGLALAGTGAAHAADVSLPAVEEDRVSVRIDNPVPGRILPPALGQSCAGALVPPHALPAVVGDVIPLLDGNVLDIIGGLGDLNDNVTILLLAGTVLPATLPGVAGTLAAAEVRDDFYVVPVVCAGGRDSAPLEVNLFLTQVGNPLGAFEGSVTGSVEGTGSAEGSSIGLGSAEIGIGSEDGMIDLGSASGDGPGSTVGADFQGSAAELTTGSAGLGLGAGSAGSDAASGVSLGSVENGSAGTLDTASLTSSLEWPAGSSDGSSIDVGSTIPVAISVAGSIGDLPRS